MKRRDIVDLVMFDLFYALATLLPEWDPQELWKLQAPYNIEVTAAWNSYRYDLYISVLTKTIRIVVQCVMSTTQICGNENSSWYSTCAVYVEKLKIRPCLMTHHMLEPYGAMYLRIFNLGDRYKVFP